MSLKCSSAATPRAGVAFLQPLLAFLVSFLPAARVTFLKDKSDPVTSTATLHWLPIAFGESSNPQLMWYLVLPASPASSSPYAPLTVCAHHSGLPWALWMWHSALTTEPLLLLIIVSPPHLLPTLPNLSSQLKDHLPQRKIFQPHPGNIRSPTFFFHWT